MTSRTTRASNHTGARRNLFHQHLSRRAPASSTGTSATTTIQVATAASEDTSEEIVVRDKNGEYQFEIPTMPVAGQDETLEKESTYYGVFTSECGLLGDVMLMDIVFGPLRRRCQTG